MQGEKSEVVVFRSIALTIQEKYARMVKVKVELTFGGSLEDVRQFLVEWAAGQVANVLGRNGCSKATDTSWLRR